MPEMSLQRVAKLHINFFKSNKLNLKKTNQRIRSQLPAFANMKKTLYLNLVSTHPCNQCLLSLINDAKENSDSEGDE